MSHALPAAAEAAAGIDWKVFASAVAVFVATTVTTIWGWLQGRKKAEESNSHIRAPGTDIQVVGAVLQDNLSLRENTAATIALRDQVMLLVHLMERRIGLESELVDELKEVRDMLRKLG